MVQKFDGTNFISWRFKLKSLLIDKGVWEAISNENKRVVEAKVESRAYTMIILALEDPQLCLVKSCETAKAIWNRLDDLYTSKSIVRMFFLRKRFFTTTMAEGDTMAENIDKVNFLAEKLQLMKATVIPEDIVMVLLGSLPPSYCNIVTSLESQDPQRLTLAYVEQILLNEDARRTRKAAGHTIIGKNVTFSGKTSGKTGKKKKQGICNYCKKEGHWAAICFKKKSNQANKPVSTGKASSTRNNQERLAFVQALAHKEVKLLKSSWIIDSGCSHHLTGDKAWFGDYINIEARKVYLGDNTFYNAIGKGTFSLPQANEASTTILEVLHVPGIAHNLLSVSKLVGTGVLLDFKEDRCVLRKNDTDIAVAFKKDNLYILEVSRRIPVHL